MIYLKPSIKIDIRVNEIAALCDLGVSVSTISKRLFYNINLGPFEITKIKIHLAHSTYKQVVRIQKILL
jgi:hypothetical protein